MERTCRNNGQKVTPTKSIIIWKLKKKTKSKREPGRPRNTWADQCGLNGETHDEEEK